MAERMVSTRAGQKGLSWDVAKAALMVAHLVVMKDVKLAAQSASLMADSLVAVRVS